MRLIIDGRRGSAAKRRVCWQRNLCGRAKAASQRDDTSSPAVEYSLGLLVLLIHVRLRSLSLDTTAPVRRAAAALAGSSWRRSGRVVASNAYSSEEVGDILVVT